MLFWICNINQNMKDLLFYYEKCVVKWNTGNRLSQGDDTCTEVLRQPLKSTEGMALSHEFRLPECNWRCQGLSETIQIENWLIWLRLRKNFRKEMLEKVITGMSVKLTMYSADLSSELSLPFAPGCELDFLLHRPRPFTDSIDPNRELIRHPATNFYARASGDSMKDCGIDDGDLLVIDKALEPQDGDIVVALSMESSRWRLCALTIRRKCIWLVPANEEYSPH